MRIDDFDFDLPEERIALRPAVPRDSSRLLAIDGGEGNWRDLNFSDLPDLLKAGDALVFNDTRVIPSRLRGYRAGRGGTTPKVEVTLHRRVDASRWWAFAKPARKLIEGDRLTLGGDASTCFAEDLTVSIEQKAEGGEVLLAFDLSGPALDSAIAAQGIMPLPPYIASKRPPDTRDAQDYQTVYSRHEGAVAAPTAGLHFTDGLLQKLDAAGIQRVAVTLHVGAGTFLPVKAEDTDDHVMHAEWGEVTPEAADVLRAVQYNGGRIVCAGTTSLRLLESTCAGDGEIRPFSGETDIFITPGYRFRAADMLITNFHLPKSTLFMLVCAFAGTELMKRAYTHAIDAQYRFYSYGDACLLTRQAG